MTAVPNSGNYVDFDEYVGLKLEKTRSTIRLTDLLTSLAGVTALFLGYLLVFVVLDQWVIPGGVSVFWRWILLSTLMIATVAWTVLKVGIPSFRSVSGLYAAHEIEKAEPELKSNLLNLIDLKEAGRSVNPQILKAMERQAAVRLQTIDVSQVVDHKPLIHAAYVLLAVIVIFCFYALLSPKKISNSIWRGLLPASQVPLATVTEIIDVKPGDQTIPAHQPMVNVQVDLAGEIPPQVWLLYTTADGKQDQPIELRTEQEGQPRFIGQLIGDGTQGLTHDVSYFIRAGDAVSRTYRITVEQPPYADVDNIRIEFPSYMKLQPVEQQKNGAIDAWEGAKVTLTAKTNMPVRSGTLQFLDEAAAAPTGEEIAMSTSNRGQLLQAQWTLSLRSDGSFPKYYRIHCKTEDGRVTTGHVIHPLVIRPDLPPEVVLLQPDRDLEAPANATIPLLIQARDPDFELTYLFLNVEKAGQRIQHDVISEARQSRLTLKQDLELSRLRPAVGDTLEFWIEAFDNRQPRPNSRNTPKIKIQIVAPVTQKEAEQQLADQKERRDQKLAEANQEMNPDRQDGQPPRDDNPQERQPQDAARPNETERTRPENAQQDQKPQDDQQGGQQSKKQAQQGKNEQNQGQNSGNARDARQGGAGQKQSQPGAGQSGETSNKNQNLKNDGSQDDEVLRKISDRLKKNQSQKPDNAADQPSQENKPAESQAKNQQGQPDGTKSPPNQSSEGEKSSQGKTEQNSRGQNQSTDEKKQPGNDPQERQGGESTADGDQPEMRKPDAEKNGADESAAAAAKESKPDASKPDKSKPDQSKSAQKSGEAASNEKMNQPGDAQGSSDEKGNPDQRENSNAANGEKKPRNQNAGDEKNPSDSGSKPQAGQKSSDSADQEKSDAKSGKGDSSTPDRSAKEDSSTDMKNKSANQTPPQKDSQGKPSGDATDPQSKAKGRKEQVPDSPDAQKGKADGTEQGVGKPDQDPKNEATPAKNDQVKRDPKSKSKSGDPNSEPADAKKGEQNPKSDSSNGPQPAGQQDASDMKNGEPAGKKSDPADQPDGKKSSSASDSKKTENGQPQAGQPGKEAMPTDPSQEGAAKKSSSDQQKNSDSSSAAPADAKSGQKDGGDERKGDPSKSGDAKQGNAKQDQRKPQGTSPDENSQEKPGSGEKPMNNQPAGDKGDPQEKQSGDAKPKDDAGGGDKKSASKSAEKSADKGGGQSEKGAQGKGQSGKGKGESGESGSEKGDSEEGQGGQSGSKGSQGKMPSKEGSSTGPAGPGGVPGNGDPGESQGSQSAELAPGEDANLEYNRKATELILQKLRRDLERGEADPEMLKELGWTPEEMKKFTDRLSQSLSESKQSEESPEAKARQEQFQEMLRNLDLKSAGSRRSGENEPKRDVTQIESKRTQPPPAYRSVFERFTKDSAKQKPPAKDAAPSK